MPKEETPVSAISFDSFDLHPRILSNVTALGYKTPTPIQQKSIPTSLLGHDVMGLAQTGTGKTAAFLLPILQRLLDGPRGKVRALIISPTRELAQQTHEAIGELGKDLGLRSATFYGGVNINPQIQKLRRGIDIAVACPGRLLDHVQQRTIDLSGVEVLVLDEADHMFDVGFLPNIRQILKQLPKKRQSLLFSATMPNEVRQLAHDILHNPVTVQISNTAPVKSVAQALYPVAQHLKTELLIKLLQTNNIFSALVFTRTKHRAKRVAEQLVKAGYSATSLQGNLSQNKRQAALNDFRSEKLQILVATDIASRGIDVASVSHVVNYDFPDTVEAYTHRIGRTGRAAKLGDAYTLLAREDSAKLRTLERTLGTKIEQRMVPDFDYKASGAAHSDEPRRPRNHEHRGRPAAKSGDRTGAYRGKAAAKRGARSEEGNKTGHAPAGRSNKPKTAFNAESKRPAIPKKRMFTRTRNY